MLDFQTFELNRLSALMKSMKEYTQNNLRFPKAGELIEVAYDVYSKGQLKRVNLPGVDLIDTTNGIRYESKVTQLKNKAQMSVRSVIIKNSRSKAAVYGRADLADYYIFTDIKLGKACCVPSKMLYGLDFNGATMKAHCNPTLDDFFLIGYDGLESERDYFFESETFDYDYVRSF